jgi:hypothetical protein
MQLHQRHPQLIVSGTVSHLVVQVLLALGLVQGSIPRYAARSLALGAGLQMSRAGGVWLLLVTHPLGACVWYVAAAVTP